MPNSYDLEHLEEIYNQDGPLAAGFKNYKFRTQQLELAEKIYQTIKNKKILLAEAGTGTGKTLAYLVPAIYSDKTVVISTGTKNLQNQLYLRDLPQLIKTLRLPIKTALLKGRSNYLCKYRLELALTDLLLASQEMVLQLKQIVSWAESTDDGDISSLPDVAEDSPVWGYVTSTADNCLGQDCPFINNCFVYNARQRAMDAKIIVVNHHLLLSDWAIKSENLEAKLLPNGVNLILDEAHQIAHIATIYFGTVVSSKKMRLLLQDILLEQQNEAKDQPELAKSANEVINILDEMQKVLSLENDRGFYRSLLHNSSYNLSAAKLFDGIKELLANLEVNAERSKGLMSCHERALQLFEDLKIFYSTDNVKSKTDDGYSLDNIKWYEVYKQSFIFKQSPLDISEIFSDHVDEMAVSCVLTSATLSVADSFDLITSDLGLKHAQTIKIKSPFDYPNKSLLYIPRSMPDPMADNYMDAYIEQVIPVLRYAKGHAFLLFTSYNAMHIAYQALSEHFSGDNMFNLLMQGTASKSSLIERFREEENSVLLATASFWEGVDVKGSDLHCVVIDKLPFASPSDPVLQSKINNLHKQGKNPFRDLQCQQAALQLTQGAGRLIRSENDYGVLMICDSRILSRSYGDIFFKSLPDMARTRELEKIKQFYQDNVI